MSTLSAICTAKMKCQPIPPNGKWFYCSRNWFINLLVQTRWHKIGKQSLEMGSKKSDSSIDFFFLLTLTLQYCRILVFAIFSVVKFITIMGKGGWINIVQMFREIYFKKNLFVLSINETYLYTKWTLQAFLSS